MRHPQHIVVKESDLYPIIKSYFKKQGYAVFAEVACDYRGVDLVAVKGDEHIAVELKLTFNDAVVRQAMLGTHHFDKVYVAYAAKKATLFNIDDNYWALRESIRHRYDSVERRGIGILQVMPTGWIYEALEPKQQKPYRKLDLQHYVESDDDLGGVPYQRGVSEGYHELDSIKRYVTEHPDANWQEIYDNVSNHYASPRSLSGSMSQWRGFSLPEFKRTLTAQAEPSPKHGHSQQTS